MLMPFFLSNGRGERIRTSDLTVPNRPRYQTALRPVNRNTEFRLPGRLSQIELRFTSAIDRSS